MSRFDRIRAESRWADNFEGQPQHLLMLALMLCGAAWLLEGSAGRGRFLGLDSLGWAWASIWLAVLHQIVVALGFRLQLHRAVFTRAFGARDFAIWQALFLPFLLARPLTLLVAATLDAGNLGFWRPGEILLGASLVFPAAYAMQSVIRHFTIPRAAGGDHFRSRYHNMPMVREGAFRWTGNAMYGIVFLGLWGIALLFGSWQALVVAAFQHAYIWVHMYTVEAPDMRWLYATALEEADATD